MKNRYTISDYLHFGAMVWRGRRRNQAWGKQFEVCVRNGSFRLPAAAVASADPARASGARPGLDPGHLTSRVVIPRRDRSA